MELAKQYLRRKEWSMGNGQCPECCGLKPGLWDEHPDPKGHKAKCTLAYALEAVGASVQYAAAPEPPVMTLEEVADELARGYTADMGRREAWHRAITAHLEGEPKGLERNTEKADGWAIRQAYELLKQLGTSTRAVYYDERAACVRVAGLLEPIAARHTKGGKQA